MLLERLGAIVRQIVCEPVQMFFFGRPNIAKYLAREISPQTLDRESAFGEETFSYTKTSAGAQTGLWVSHSSLSCAVQKFSAVCCVKRAHQ